MAELPTKEQPEIVPAEAEEEITTITWQADKFVTYDKGRHWYTSVALIGIAVIILVIVLRNQLQVSLWSVVPVLTAGVAVMLARGLIHSPRSTYGVSEDGVIIDGDVKPYGQFRSFAVVELEGHAVLRLWPKTRFGLPTSIILEQITPDEVREIMASVLPEEPQNSSLSDRISHIVKL